jgi:hypothetical protein
MDRLNNSDGDSRNDMGTNGADSPRTCPRTTTAVLWGDTGNKNRDVAIESAPPLAGQTAACCAWESYANG